MDATETAHTEETGTNHLLADLDWCLAQAAENQRGALWRSTEPGRQLDAALVRVPAGAAVPEHTEPDDDVLLLAVAGQGTLHTDTGQVALATHTLTWLPRGTRRSITAGPGGLAYLTVRRAARRGICLELPSDPELLARLEEREEETEGGEAACMLPRLCPTCGAPASGPTPPICPVCNSAWTA
ncbi:MAG TPA: hypothetical protein VFU73_13860 [Actinocrinis sp.]|nr:hypothetical protein [Actinocrinis sp.]